MDDTDELPPPIGVMISVPWDLDHIDLESGEWVKRRYIMPVVNYWLHFDWGNVLHGAN